MNIQVNLIRPSEQRSASAVSLKFLAQIAAIVAPASLLLYIGLAYLGYRDAQSGLRLLEQEKEQSIGQLVTAQRLAKALGVQQALHGEVLGWGRSRVPWHEVFDGILPNVPDTMQWRSLQMRVSMECAKDRKLRRDHLVTLVGRCQGPDAEGQVEALRRAWMEGSSLTQWVEQAEVVSFKEDDAPEAAKEDRRFQIDVKFRPGRFDAPAGR